MKRMIMPKERFQIVGPDEAEDWNQYVLEHIKGSVFHTAEMVRVFAQTRHHRPFAVAARNHEGKIVAMLVAVRVSTIGGPLNRVASRSIMYAEPICDDDDDGIEALGLLVLAHDRAVRGTVLFSEIRPLGPAGSEQVALEKHGYHRYDYLNYVADLQLPMDELLGRVKKSCRKDVRRSEKRGLTLIEKTGPECCKQLYHFLSISYGLARVPLPDKSLFDATCRTLPKEWYRIVIAYLDDQPIASSVDLVFKGAVFGWYGGTTRVSGVAANACITLDSIQWAHQNGHQLYDFGGAGRPEDDYKVRDFKSKFGAELVNFGRYRKVSSKWKMAIAGRAYGIARHVLAANKMSRPLLRFPSRQKGGYSIDERSSHGRSNKRR